MVESAYRDRLRRVQIPPKALVPLIESGTSTLSSYGISGKGISYSKIILSSIRDPILNTKRD
jgi:hypothetical protein